MNSSLTTLIELISTKDLKGLVQHYQQADEADNLTHLRFLFDQAMKSPAGFEFYQQLATAFIEAKGLPDSMIVHINNADTLSFFTPALQHQQHFSQTNRQGRNVLHFLLAGDQQVDSKQQPPFNYLRSMMLFESNEVMHQALCVRDQQNLTPIEVYLFANQNLTELPNHEFTALLALIEIQSKQLAVHQANCRPIARAVAKRCVERNITPSASIQRFELIALYYGVAVQQILP